MLKWFKRFRKSEKGQGMIEYGLILALVSIVSIGALGGIGDGVKGTFDKTMDAFGGNVPPQEEVGSQSVYTNAEIENLVSQGYIKVATAEELNNVRNGLSGKYIQVKDIDLSGITNFEPIGTLSNEFKGTFDGGGYEIKNLTVDKGASDYAGLFGRVEGATFKNIGLEKVNVTGRDYTGGLVGYQQNSSEVSNSYATGEVNGKDYTGGLVGYQQTSSTVTNSYATGSVTGSGNRTGGLVGQQHNSSRVSNSYATGTVKGGGQTGGLVGRQDGSSVSNSYATGSVNGAGSNTGGLVGWQSGSSVSNSYYDKETTGQMTSVGGTGKTTAEMKEQATYTGWNFESIWTIESNQYPTLR